MDDQLDILIRSIADRTGANITKADLDEIRQKIGAVGPAADGLQAPLKKVNETLQDGAKRSTGHIEGLHRAIGFVGHQFGQVGRLAHFAFNPIVLAVAALGIGLHYLAEHIKKLNDAILERADEINAMWAARKQAQQDAQDVMEKYSTTIGHVVKSTATLKTEEAEELKTLQAIITARAALLAAAEKAELIASAGNKAREEEIKAKYGKQSTADELAAEKAKIDLRKQFLEKQRAELFAAEARFQAATREAASLPVEATEAAAEAGARIAARTPKLKELEADVLRKMVGRTLAELKADADREAAMPPSPYADQGVGDAAGMYYRAAKEATEKYAAAQKEIDAAKDTVKLVEDEKKRRAEAVAKTDADLKVKADAFQADERGITEDEKIYNIHKRNQEKIAVTQFPGAGTPQGRELIDAAGGAAAILHHLRATAEQARAINAALKDLDYGTANQTTLTLLAKITANQKSFENALNILNAKNDNLPR